ncbi:MAG TPA: hypothetical protein DF427_02255 [Moraxellaceae bacterium]|nr:hypothetical protein [Moraxellaceae bacterium]
MRKPKPAYIIVAIAFLTLSFLLNPSADKHREKITQSISERSQLEGVLGVGQLTAFAARYKSLGIASYTTVNGAVVSIGALGMVFFVD